MFKSLEDGERLIDESMTCDPVKVGDKPHSTGVVLKLWVVKTLG